MSLLTNVFRSKGSAMTTENVATAATAVLPAGHDVEGPWFVPEHLRADYAAIVEVPAADKLRHRDFLAGRLYAEGMAQLERDEIAKMMRRGGNEDEARKVMFSNGMYRLNGRFEPGVDEEMRLHGLYDVGGAEWPDDAAERIAHAARLELAKRAHQQRISRARSAEAARCPMCNEVRRKQMPAAGRPESVYAAEVGNRVPVPGLGSVRCCGQCAVVIANTAAERLAAAAGAGGKTRGELAAQWLDAQVPAAAER